MAELTYRDAVARGIAQEMTRDPDVVFLGEDVAKAGGVFKATVGLYEQFGPLRVRDTPISEQAILGAAMGAPPTLKPYKEDGTVWPFGDQMDGRYREVVNPLGLAQILNREKTAQHWPISMRNLLSSKALPTAPILIP